MSNIIIGPTIQVAISLIPTHDSVSIMSTLQLVPLLTECWSEDPVPSADDILQRLCEVLPTAAV